MDGAARVGFPGAYPIVTSAVKSQLLGCPIQAARRQLEKVWARRHSKTAPRKTRPHEMKFTSSGSGSFDRDLEERSGSGWVIPSPSEAKSNAPLLTVLEPASEHRPQLAIFNFQFCSHPFNYD